MGREEGVVGVVRIEENEKGDVGEEGGRGRVGKGGGEREIGVRKEERERKGSGFLFFCFL